MFHDHQDCLGGPYFDSTTVSAAGRLLRLHKGGSQVTDALTKKQKKQDDAFMRMMMQQSRQKVEMPQMPAIPAAPTPDPVPPPPSQSSADVEDAKAEARRASARRYGLLRTTYAGATGGYGGDTPMGGRRSLLG